jgi:stage III sporulation protein SpoIIIAA
MTKETLNSRVAVLETKVEAISIKLDEVKADIKEVHACLHKTREMILEHINTGIYESHEAHVDINKRINKLENWRWYILGMAVTVGVIAKFIF